MNPVEKFNGLNGQKISRDELVRIAQEAEEAEQPEVVARLSAILDNYPDEYFEINVTSPAIEVLPASVLGCLDCITDPEDTQNLGLGKKVTPQDIYQLITDKMIQAIKEATGRGYKKKWKDGYVTDANGEPLEGYLIPHNFVSKKPYRGINMWLLSKFNGLQILPQKNPFYLTFKQIEKLGGKLQKGAKGKEVVFYSILYKIKNDQLDYATYDREQFIQYLLDNGVAKKEITSYLINSKIPILRYYNVFSGEDVEGIDFDLENWKKGYVALEKKGDNNERLEIAEMIVSNYPKPEPKLKEGNSNRAYYSPKSDLVRMPHLNSFDTSQDYYRTLFHEFIHSTGAEHRLNRDFSGGFGSKPYAKEELVAEFGAVFLSAQAGIIWHTNKNHAEYLKNWHNVLGIIEEDNKFIMRAASDAQRAADFILQPDEEGVPLFLKKLAKNEKAEKKTGNEAKKSELKEETQTTKIFEIIKDYQAGKELNNDELKQVLINNLKEKNLKKGSYSHYGGIEIQQSEIPASLFTPIKIQNKNPEQSLKIICSKDNLRPALTGIFVDKGKYVATDAHALVVLHTKTKKGDEGKILNINEKKSGQTGKYIDANYPKYEGVIPIYKNETGYIDINELLRITNTAIKLFYPLSGTQSIELEKDLLYNPALLHKLLKVLAETGTKKVKLSAAPSRALKVVGDNKNFGIIMPLTPGDFAIFRTKPYLKGGVNIKAGLNGISNDLFEGLKAPTASNPDTINFNKEILKAKRNGIKPRQIFFLGHTKGVLKTYVGDRKMYVSGANIQKSMTKDKAHSVKWETLINLPDNLNNPIAIFKSKTAGNVIVTALFDEKDKAYMVAVHANRHFRIKEIKSIYSKDDKRIYSKWENEGLLIWKDEKSDLLERIFPALIAGASKKPHHKTTKKTQPTKKRGLKSPVIPLLPDNQVQVQEETPVITSPPQATTENTAPVTPRPKSFLNAGHGENKFFDVPGETGKFLQMVERKPVGSVVVTIDGPQGAGKTTLLYRFMNDFAGGNNRCLFLSGEEHPESFLAIEKKNKYIDLENQGNIDIIDEVSTIRELYGWIEEYDIIFIDSWQKLQRMIGNIRLDEDLRKKFDGKVFIVIFQQTTTGRTKGGAEIVFDGDIIIKMQKEPVFTDNFAYFDKNRYTRVPLELLRYNIAGGYVYNPCENDLTETTPPTPENLLIEIEEL